MYHYIGVSGKKDDRFSPDNKLSSFVKNKGAV